MALGGPGSEKENGMVSFTWTFGSEIGARATPGEATVTSFSGKDYQSKEGGLKIVGMIDLVMAAIAGSADEALNWKADKFMDMLVSAATKKQGIEDILFEMLMSTNYLDITGQVGGSTSVSYKLPTQIAKELGSKWKEHIAKVAKKDKKFTAMMERDSLSLSKHWRQDLGMNSWRGNLISDGHAGSSWWSTKSDEFVSGTGAYALPFFAGGRAGAAAEPGKSGNVFKNLRKWSP